MSAVGRCAVREAQFFKVFLDNRENLANFDQVLMIGNSPGRKVRKFVPLKPVLQVYLAKAEEETLLDSIIFLKINHCMNKFLRLVLIFLLLTLSAPTFAQGTKEIVHHYAKSAINELISLRDDKGEMLKKEDPAFIERIQNRKRKVNEIVATLNKCRRGIPKDNENALKLLDLVIKRLPESAAANIDAKQGYPTAEAVKDINNFIRILKYFKDI